jgi:hypothetical protein
LAPLNSQRVLKDMEKPRGDTVDAAGVVPLVPGDPQHESPVLTAAPITPVTPVTAEAFHIERCRETESTATPAEAY